MGVNANSTYTVQASDFHFSDDPTDIPANNLKAVQVTAVSLGSSGATLTNAGTPITANSTISVSDIVNGKLLFTAPSQTPDVFFSFKVQDDGGTPIADTDPTAKTLTFHVFAFPHAPTAQDKSINSALGNLLTEDHAYTFATPDFGFADVDGNSLLNVIVTSVSGSGSFAVNGSAVGAGSIIAASDISGGLFKYTPAADANGADQASFLFRVQDNGGTDNGGAGYLDPAQHDHDERHAGERRPDLGNARRRSGRQRREPGLRTARPRKPTSPASSRASTAARPTNRARR